MELRKILLIFHFCFISICFAESKPFGSGYSMLSSKSVALANDMSGRDPTISSAFLSGVSVLSFNMFYVSYYNKSFINEYRDDRAMFGASYSKNKFALKCSFESFNFMSIYLETELYGSFAYKFRNRLNTAVNFKHYRKSILVGDYEKIDMLKFSLTSVLNMKTLLFAIDLNTGPYNCSRNKIEFNLSYIDIIISTNSKGYFNQGIRINLSPFMINESRFFWALSLKTYGPIHLNFNISTNPVLFGCGITFKFNKSGIYFGTIIHPKLGVSTGVGLEQLILRR